MNLIIDGYNIAFRCHHVYDVQQGLKTSSGVPTGIVYGFLKTLLKWHEKYPKHTIFVAWDTPNGSDSRREVYADYKANRDRDFDKVAHPESESDEMIDIFSLQIEFLRNFLRSLGINQARVSGYEADDVIATLVRDHLSDENNIILSSDRDLLQLVTWKTILMTPSEKAYDPEKVKEEYGVTPENLLCYRVFDGDTSDNLPGLPRFRRKVIARIVNEHDGDLESIYNEDIEDLTDKEREKLAAFQKQAHLNREVMELKDVEEFEVVTGKLNTDQIEGMCELLEFESIESDLLEFDQSNQGFLRYNDEPILRTTD